MRLTTSTVWYMDVGDGHIKQLNDCSKKSIPKVNSHFYFQGVHEVINYVNKSLGVRRLIA